MESSKLIDTLEIRDFSKKMSATYGFIRQNFASFWKSLLLIAGPPIVVGGIFTGDIFNRFISANISQRTSGFVGDDYDYFNSGMFWLQMLSVVVFLWLGGVITVATTYGYLRAYHGHKRTDIPLAEVWTNVRKSFWRHFGTMILFSLISGIIIFVAALPVFFIVSVVSSTVWIVGVLMIGFVVFTVYFTSNFFMIFVCREMEKSSFGEAVQRILYLVKTKTWSTFGITSINLYIQYAMSLVLFVPWYIIQLVTLTHSVNASEEYGSSGFLPFVNIVFMALYFLFYILLYAIPMLGIGFQYFNLVEIKESRGLMQNIEAFGKEPQSVADEHY
jgi:hypothetical protein